jgi:hypothetical protein
LARRGLEPFSGAALEALCRRLPERLLRVLELHFEAPNPAEGERVLALLAALPESLLGDAVTRMAGKQLVRLPGSTLAGTRRLLHRAVSAGGSLARLAYPVFADLEERLSVTRRA